MAVLTINQYIDTIDSFIKNVTSSKNAYYVFYGKPTPWQHANGQIDDTYVPPANGSVYSYEQSIYKDLIFGKLVTENDISYMIPRYNWTNNTYYDSYNQQDPDIYSKQFYVVTDLYEVYKCIDNNNGANSTVKPSLTTTSGVFSTSDGYVWKYMFTIQSNANTKFTSSSYVPVTPNNEVIVNSVNGSIDFIKVTNTGNNYQAHHSGFLQNFVNPYNLQIANTGSSINNRYTGSSIYLKSGFGSGQIRKIINYNGLNRIVTVGEPFNTYSVLNIGDVQGTIAVGNKVEQRIDSLYFLYNKGYFNVGDLVIQSDTGANGIVLTSNSSTLKVIKNSVADFSQNLPVYNPTYGGVLKSGTVDFISGNNKITANTGTPFSGLSAGDYVRIGDNANNNIRRVLSVNLAGSPKPYCMIDSELSSNVVANTIYAVNSAIYPTSVGVYKANGVISNTNLNSQTLTFNNVSITSRLFTIGERVDMVGENDVAQGANGVVSFSNSSTVILGNISGTFLTGPNNFIKGFSSLQKANILSTVSFPNITIFSPEGRFISGEKLFVKTIPDGTNMGNATIISSFQIPNELTEYIISPTVTITGDGNGALAYSVVNSAFQSANEIPSIVVLNPGNNYTYANVTITSNSNFGNGAVGYPIVSPLMGHGSDPNRELGAKYAGISMVIDTGENESYKFPVYGSYRRVGIIENPLFEDVTAHVSSYDRINLTIANKSGSGFVNNEVVIQPSTNASGSVVFSNSTLLQIKNARGSFNANVSTDSIYALSSGTTANVKVANTVYFRVSNVVIVSEITSNTTAKLVDATDTSRLKLTNVSGRFDANDVVYDSVINAYATVDSIYTVNNTIDSTYSFGRKFSQLGRLTLTSNTGSFVVGEKVTQDVTGAYATVLSTNTDIDIIYGNANGTFNVGNIITDSSSGATATITYANSTFVRLTSLSGGKFTVGHRMINNVNIGADISNVYNVLVLNDVNGSNKFQISTYPITGNTSGAIGKSQLEGSLVFPELIRNSGSVVYVENVAPITRSETSKEQINLVIKF